MFDLETIKELNKKKVEASYGEPAWYTMYTKTETTPSKPKDEYSKVLEELEQIYRKKNADYGDSFTAVRNKFPIHGVSQATLVRLNDKLNRLMTLYNAGEKKVEDESIYDTLIDLANYAIMEATAMRKDASKDE